MSKFAAPLLVATCLVGVASTAQATPVSSCAFGSVLNCTLAEGQNSSNPEYGFLSQGDLTDVGGLSGWDLGWTFILDPGTSYAGIADNGNVSDIVHICDGGATLWSQGYANSGETSPCGFGAAGGPGNFDALLSFVLGSTAANTVQVVGEPLFPGALRFTTTGGGEIGLWHEGGDGIAHLADLSGTFACPTENDPRAVCGFSGDTLDIVSSQDGRVVPEPATLTLMGLGGALAAFRRRRKMV